jgi:glycosyltransferase involved in cell wall biosynthesis
VEKNGSLVSICMPAYNAGKYISEAVRSVLNQSYQNWELIIVNDGSTDQTAAELEKINESRISIFHQDNKGQCNAANKAFSLAKGNLVKFMDADDLISPTFIEKQVKRIEGRDDVVVSAAWGRFYNDDISTFKLNHKKISQDMPGTEWLENSWLTADAMMQCALWLIPRNIINRAGLWDESLSLINDLDFFTRILIKAKMVLFEKDAVLYYRSGISGSLSDKKTDQAILSLFKSIDQATTNLSSVAKSDKALLACANMWQLLIYQVYPKYPNHVRFAEKRIKDFKGSSLKFECGGITKILVSFIGWRLTKKIKHFLNV